MPDKMLDKLLDYLTDFHAHQLQFLFYRIVSYLSLNMNIIKRFRFLYLQPPGADLGFAKGRTMASTELEPITGVWGRSQRGPEAAAQPLLGLGAKPA